MDVRERQNDLSEALLVALSGLQAQLWTALPGVIQSVNLTAQTVTVQPTIQVQFTDPATNLLSWITIPVLVDVPIMYPSGGGFTLTFPILKGDECLILFASRCIDAWWQQGANPGADPGRPQLDLRLHDLSDGFAFVGVRSQPRVLTAISATTTQLRSDDGTTYVEIAGGKIVNVVAPNGIRLTGPTKITGTLEVTQAATFDSTVTATGEGTFNGGHTVSAHTHGGVTTGSGTTGTPSG